MKFKSDVDVEAALAVSGDVGVGTTAPLRKLHVVGGQGFAVNASATQYYGVYIPALGEGADPRIDIGDWHNAGSTIKWDSSARSLNLDTQYSTGAGTFNITGNDGASTFLTVLPSGNVGIGTTNPAAKLDVQSSVTGNLVSRVYNPNTGTSSSATFRIASAANNANSARLEFSDSAYYTATISGDRAQGLVFRTSATGTNPTTIPERMRIESDGIISIGEGATQSWIANKVQTTTTAVLGKQAMSDIDRTTANWMRITNPVYSTNGSVGLIMRTFPNSDARQGAGIIASGGSDNAATDLDLFVSRQTSGATTSTSYSALSIKGNTGKVGIGTTSPDYLLDLYRSTGTTSSTTGTTLQRLWNYVGSDLNQQKTFVDFVFQDDNDNEYPQVRIGAEVGQNGDANTQEKEGSGAFVVYTNNATGTTPGTPTGLAERFRVDYQGNVGIGTTSPSEKLHVSGNLRVTGAFADSSASVGSAGTVLSSTNTGTAWVGASGLPGGPYLPLAGGTLTGALTGTAATFAGDVVTNGDITIDNTSGDPFLKLKTSAQEYVLRIDQSDSEKFQIRNTTSSVTALSIDASSNATFAGNVGLGNGTNIATFDTTANQLKLTNSYSGGASGMAFYSSNNTWMSTFYATTADYGYLDGEYAQWNLRKAKAGGLYLNNNSTYFVQPEGTSNMNAATFTGTVTSPTFLGDLNGTINTVTTAVTKANATNDTTVATTAFVQNLIGTIPAGLVFQGTWNAATNTPTLTSGSGTTGHFYIVSTSGSTNLDGVTDWVTGDWAVFIEQGGTDAWEKIDNSSVLDGAGTGQTVPLWSGSGTSNTLTDSPITVSSNNSTFAGNIIAGSNSVQNGANPGLKIQSTNTSQTVLSIDNTTTRNYEIAVGGSASGVGAGSLYIYDGSATDARMVINTSGNVGIGMTNPGAKLEIKGDGGVAGLTFKTTDSSSNETFFIQDGGAVGVRYSPFSIGIPNGTAVATNALFQVEEAGLLTVLNNGDVGIGTTAPAVRLDFGSATGKAFHLYTSGADYYGFNMLQYDSGPFSTNIFSGNGGEIKLRTVTGSSTAVTRLTVKAAGNVGIGTTDPGAKLDVRGSGGYLKFDSSGADGTIKSDYNLKLYADDTGDNSSGFQNIQFFTAGANEKMRIDSAGNVLIGATANVFSYGGRTLHVGGSRATLALKSTGSLSTFVMSASNSINTTDIHLNQSGADGSLSFYQYSAGGTTMTLDGDGKLGIGVTAPQSKLQVDGGIQMADDTATATSTKVGTMRYRTDTEYVEVDGVELVTNGDFATDTGWTKGTGWTISGGTADAATATSDFTQTVSFTLGQTYRLTYTVSNYSAGAVRTSLGAYVANTPISANGNYTDIFTPTNVSSNSLLYFEGQSGFTGSIDNVSMVEVTSEDASYADMCMQTGSSTYEWVNIVRNTY
jgi:hypothetical protein